MWELQHEHGYELHVVWGHELRETLERNPQLRQLWNTQIADQVVRPLDPREDALRGGRTEPFVLHHRCRRDEEIICIDIVINFLLNFFHYPLPSLTLPVSGQSLSLCDEGT